MLCNTTLRQPPNLLLLALAVTDLLVSLLVMPGALSQHMVGYWPGSPWLCLTWVFSDVFLCTSSILSLTAICIGKIEIQDRDQESNDQSSVILLAGNFSSREELCQILSSVKLL